MKTSEIQALTPTTIQYLLNGQPLASASDAPPERRRAPRWPFASPVELWVTDARQGERYILGTCENLSADGLGLLCDEPLPVGQQVGVAIHQPVASLHGKGMIRHCRQVGQRYYAGLEFVFDGTAGNDGGGGPPSPGR
jgi:hypothetical protein